MFVQKLSCNLRKYKTLPYCVIHVLSFKMINKINYDYSSFLSES